MRMVFDPVPADGARGAAPALRARSWPSRFEMDHRFAESSERKRVAIMVSREDHCLSDLLWRWRSGELGAELTRGRLQPPDHAEQVAALGLPFHHVPVDGRRQGGGGAAQPRAARRRARPARPRPLHAGPLRRLPRASWARRRSTSTTASCPPSSAPTPTAGPRARGQADRRHRPLRHRGARRRADHRPGRDPGQPPRRGRAT